ncbi:MAG: DUF2382 domain-containing protein [Phormidesmis sp.]
MALHRISDRYPNYPDVYFDGKDIKGKPVYSAESHNVGTVDDVLIDEENRLQFIVLKRKSGRRVLVPASRCADSPERDLIYVRSLNRDEIKALPTYDTTHVGEGAVAQQIHQTVAVEQSASVEQSAILEGAVWIDRPAAVSADVPQADVPQAVTAVPEREREQSIQLFEERLTTRKQRVKTGEVKISKRTVTERTEAAVPITREKVIIEIESIYGGETRVNFGDAEVDDNGIVRMGIYEDQAEVCRTVVPQQNVTVRKEVVRDVVRAEENLRREELDINPEGLPYVNWQDLRTTPATPKSQDLPQQR